MERIEFLKNSILEYKEALDAEYNMTILEDKHIKLLKLNISLCEEELKELEDDK
jgi:hypothetical protein